ncbi:MAG: hypothetical protein R2847_08790 [Bacteroidia bacterium]
MPNINSGINLVIATWGFVTAGAVIKAVTDTSWQDFFQHRFFDKLAYEKEFSLLL